MRFYYYLHFTDEETEAERLSNVLVWKRKMFIRKMNSKPSQPHISRNKYCGKGNQGRQETLKRDPKSVSQQQNRTIKPPKTSQTWGRFGQTQFSNDLRPPKLVFPSQYCKSQTWSSPLTSALPLLSHFPSGSSVGFTFWASYTVDCGHVTPFFRGGGLLQIHH